MWQKTKAVIRLLRARIPEATALLLGALLRISMAITHDARIGFDFNGHWPYITYVAAHHSLAPLTRSGRQLSPAALLTCWRLCR